MIGILIKVLTLMSKEFLHAADKQQSYTAAAVF
jgi:hypothetical protein